MSRRTWSHSSSGHMIKGWALNALIWLDVKDSTIGYPRIIRQKLCSGRFSLQRKDLPCISYGGPGTSSSGKQVNNQRLETSSNPRRKAIGTPTDNDTRGR